MYNVHIKIRKNSGFAVSEIRIGSLDYLVTLDSGIGVGHKISMGHHNFNSFLHKSRHCGIFMSPKFNKRRALGPSINKSKINKHRAYVNSRADVYSGLFPILE